MRVWARSLSLGLFVAFRRSSGTGPQVSLMTLGEIFFKTSSILMFSAPWTSWNVSHHPREPRTLRVHRRRHLSAGERHPVLGSGLKVRIEFTNTARPGHNQPRQSVLLGTCRVDVLEAGGGSCSDGGFSPALDHPNPARQDLHFKN